MKVFLGGTCNGSTWRDDLIPMLECDYFNPVVADWTPEFQAEELRQREECDACLYVISKEMTGAYSIAEAVDDSNKRPQKTIFCVLTDGFTASQIKSFRAINDLIVRNGGISRGTLAEVAAVLNERNRRVAA